MSHRRAPLDQRLLLPLLAAMLALGAAIASTAPAQTPADQDPGLTALQLDEAFSQESAAATASNDELLRRLLATEARLEALELEQQQSFDPAADEVSSPPPPEEEPEKKWYDKYSLRGYAQFRVNEVLHEEPGSAPAQHVGDRSVGDDQSFLIRRARLIFAADVSEHLYIYLQPDFAVSPPSSPDATHFAQIRDWYGDIYCDATKVNRFRVGQSKVPFGWENLQSSSNRLLLDRSDSLNSAGRNERDLGVFYYWTPEYAQDVFAFINDEGLKGSGNYGVFGLGAYNGQGGSLLEQNDNLHVVSRFTYPFFLDNGQLVELGVQGYTGKYTVLSTPISPLGVGGPVRPAGTLETGNRPGIRDERIAWTAVYYPKPLGFQTEWNVGRGPALNEAQTEVGKRALYGGYAMVNYRVSVGLLRRVLALRPLQLLQGGLQTGAKRPVQHHQRVGMRRRVANERAGRAHDHAHLHRPHQHDRPQLRPTSSPTASSAATFCASNSKSTTDAPLAA